jgi:hypothetical protein
MTINVLTVAVIFFTAANAILFAIRGIQQEEASERIRSVFFSLVSLLASILFLLGGLGVKIVW